MNRTILAITFLAAASLSQAAVLTVNCVTSGQILTTGTLTFNCSNALSSDAGFTLTSVAVQAIASWSDSTTGTPNGLTFTWTTVNGSTLTKTTPNDDFVGTTAPLSNGNAIAISGTTFTGGVNFVSLTTTLNAGTSVFPDAHASSTINLVATQSPIVPEPGTLSLVGSALIALGFAARRVR